MALHRKRHRGLSLRFDRVLSHNLMKQFGVLLVMLFVTFWLSYFLLSLSGSDWQTFCDEHGLKRWLLPLYLLIDTNALNNLYINGGVHGWMLLASSLIYVFGVFLFQGMIISVMTNFISRRVDEHQGGHIHYLTSGHYVIMGYDDMVPSIISHIFEKDKDAYVLLLTAAEAMKVHERLRRTFREKELQRVIINYGHRMSKDYYSDIFLENAQEIFIVGLRQLPAHDAINVECVDSICKYLKPFSGKTLPSRITCVFEDLDTYAAFKTSEIFNEVRDLGIEFVPYNFYAGWAKQVFVQRQHRDLDGPESVVNYPAVYGQGITYEDPRRVHLVFIGTSNFSVAFAMEAAHVLHFPNFKRDHNLRTLITFIDLNADTEKDLFITRNRHFFEVQSYYYCDLTPDAESESRVRLEPTVFNRTNGYDEERDANFLDVEFEFIKGDVFSQRVQREIRTWAQDREGQYLSIFLAMADQRSNFAMGMNMPDEVYDNEIPIFIRQDRSDNFVTNLRNADRKKTFTYYNTKDTAFDRPQRYQRYAHIYPFGMNEMGFSADDRSLRCAKLINYLYETANYDVYEFKTIMELEKIDPAIVWADAEKYWRKLTVALKWSNLYCAYNIPTKLACIRAMRGMSIDNTTLDTELLSQLEINRMASVEHNRWNVEKLLMGFRKARPEEDKYIHGNEFAQNKKLFIHHDLRPFKELDEVWKLDKEISSHIPWIVSMIK